LKKSYEHDWLINKCDDPKKHLLSSMQPDDLKAIWICHECRTKFLFHSDIDDHKDSTGHKLIAK
jgi:hypothetical protein